MPVSAAILKGTGEAPVQPQLALAQAEGEQAPRKRRRRRGGRRVDAAAPQPAAAPVAASTPASTAQPSLLSRIGRGLKSLVTRSPSKQH